MSRRTSAKPAAQRTLAKSVANPRRTAHVSPTGTAPKASPKRFEKKTIALVYDFDGTLSPRPMQEYAFLPKIGVDAAAFWAESNKVALEQGADPLITYMHLLYKKAKAAGVRIDRADLVAQGRQVELFPGVMEWFDEITAYVEEHAQGNPQAGKPALVGRRPDRSK